MVAASADGNIDDPQWKWLEKELDASTERNELIFVFAHHATGSLTSTISDEQASACGERDEHGHDTNPGCDRDPRSSEPLHLGDDLKELFLAHPHVVAFVAGHSHNNRVAHYERDERVRLLGDQDPRDSRLATAEPRDRADGELRRDPVDLRDDARPRRARRGAAGRARGRVQRRPARGGGARAELQRPAGGRRLQRGRADRPQRRAAARRPARDAARGREAAPARQAAAGRGRPPDAPALPREKRREARQGRRRPLQGQAQADEREGRGADEGAGQEGPARAL